MISEIDDYNKMILSERRALMPWLPPVRIPRLIRIPRPTPVRMLISQCCTHQFDRMHEKCNCQKVRCMAEHIAVNIVLFGAAYRNRVAIWPFLKLFAIWPFFGLFECRRKQHILKPVLEKSLEDLAFFETAYGQIWPFYFFWT